MQLIGTMCLDVIERRLQDRKENSLMTECQERVKELREATGMNRKQFCEAFEIPYRTVTEWERGTRNAPKYVLKFLEYYIQTEKIKKEQDVSEEQA